MLKHSQLTHDCSFDVCDILEVNNDGLRFCRQKFRKRPCDGIFVILADVTGKGEDRDIFLGDDLIIHRVYFTAEWNSARKVIE